MANIAQRSFAGGELAPALYARTDQTKYATGLRTCRNFQVLRSGGVANRPGTMYVGSLKDPSKRGRLVRFAFSAADAYVLEFGERYIRFIRSGAYLTATGDAWVTGTAYGVADLVEHGGQVYYCTVAHTSGSTSEPGAGSSWQTNWYQLVGGIYEIPTPYLEADLMGLRTGQSADVMTIVHPGYAPRELRRYDHTRWTLERITFGPRVGTPGNLGMTGGDSGDRRWWAVTAIDGVTNEESLPVIDSAENVMPSEEKPTTISWDMVRGALAYNVYRSTDGMTFGLIGSAGGTQVTTEDNTWGTATSDVDTVSKGVWVQAASPAENAVVATAGGKAADGQYRVRGRYLITASGGNNQVTNGCARVYYSRDGEPMVDVGTTEVNILVGGGSAQFAFARTVVVPDNGYSTLTIYLVAEVLGTSTGVTTFECDVTGESITFLGGALQFVDDGKEADYAVAPPEVRAAFDAPEDWPAVVGTHQQRRLFARSTESPETVWASRIGSPAAFTRSSPIQDDDAVIFSLSGDEVSEVRHLVVLGQLVVFTAGSEIVIWGDQAGILTPSAVNPRAVAYNGISRDLPPIVANQTVLYVQARGTIVRDLFPDAVEKYSGNDLSVFATHLFDGHQIVDWAYAKTPHSIVWAVRDDGVMLGLTYLREHEIWGWHRHDTDGVIENVCTAPEGTEDVPYLIVRREVNGSVVRYVERMQCRSIIDVLDAHFVDSGLAYDGRHTGSTTMTLSGGSSWEHGELLTLTASAGTFTAGDVGNEIHLRDAAGALVRFEVTEYSSSTVVKGFSDRPVPATLQDAAAASWGRAVDELSGLEHLEGKEVSVYADGFVVASPLNSSYPAVTVTGGSITLDRPYSRILVGLPYTSDLETLDIDAAAGPSARTLAKAPTRLGLLVESSRGIFAGRKLPPDDPDPLSGLAEYQARYDEGYDDPVALRTGFLEINLESSWDSPGRVAVRQVDPLPLTVLSIVPQGFLPASN